MSTNELGMAEYLERFGALIAEHCLPPYELGVAYGGRERVAGPAHYVLRGSAHPIRGHPDENLVTAGIDLKIEEPRNVDYEGPDVWRLEAFVEDEACAGQATRSWVLIDGDWVVDLIEDDPIQKLELAVALHGERGRA